MDASIILLYLYGYITDEEIETIRNEENSMKILDKHKEDILEIKEIYEKLKDEGILGKIPMDVRILSFGAGQVFTCAVRSVIDTLERLHKDMKYMKRRYYGGVFDWNEAVLFNALIYKYYKKGGKRWQI